MDEIAKYIAVEPVKAAERKRDTKLGEK